MYAVVDNFLHIFNSGNTISPLFVQHTSHSSPSIFSFAPVLDSNKNPIAIYLVSDVDTLICITTKARLWDAIYLVTLRYPIM